MEGRVETLLRVEEISHVSRIVDTAKAGKSKKGGANGSPRRRGGETNDGPSEGADGQGIARTRLLQPVDQDGHAGFGMRRARRGGEPVVRARGQGGVHRPFGIGNVFEEAEIEWIAGYGVSLVAAVKIEWYITGIGNIATG